MANDFDKPGNAGFLALHRVRLPLLSLVMVLALVDTVPPSLRFPFLAAVAIAITWFENGSLRPIGIGRPRSLLATLVGGVVLAAIAMAVVGQLVSPLLDELLPATWRAAPDLSLTGDIPTVPAWGGALFLLLAICEEIVFRGFLLHHLNALFGNTPLGRLVGVLLGAALFAIPQFPSGVDAVLATFLVGLLFCWVFYRSGRNLLLLMLAHALVDAWCLVVCAIFPGWLD